MSSHGQLGFSIGFGSKKTKQEREDQQNRQTQGRTQSIKRGRERAQQQQRVSTLSPEIRAGLEDVVLKQLQNAGQNAQDQSDLTNLLLQRAQAADAAFSAEPIIAEARRRGTNEIERAATMLAQQAGSAQNSFVQLMAQQSQADLESQLAALAQQLNLQGRQAATSEIAGALSAPAASITPLVQLLKGAETVGDTSTVVNSQQRLDTLQMLRELVTNLTTQRQKSRGLDFNIGL